MNSRNAETAHAVAAEPVAAGGDINDPARSFIGGGDGENFGDRQSSLANHPHSDKPDLRQKHPSDLFDNFS